MYLLVDALGLSDLADEISTVIKACAEPQPAAEARYLRGLRVGIVGDDEEIVALRKRAESYCAKLAVNITKTVVWLATSTLDSSDAKHNSARYRQDLIVSWDTGRLLVKTRGWTPFHRLEPPVSCHPFE